MASAAATVSPRVFSFKIDDAREALVRKLAEASFGGNKGRALLHLIDVHAGRALEAAEEQEDRLEVEPWHRRRLSRDLIAEVATLIQAGSLRADALKIARVAPSQAESWTKEGRADMRAGRASLYADWTSTLDKVEAELALERVRGVKDPKWLLERQSPAGYGKRSTSDATVTHRSLPMVDLERLTVEEARVFLALARKASPGADDAGISARARPIGELLPADVDGEAVELD